MVLTDLYSFLFYYFFIGFHILFFFLGKIWGVHNGGVHNYIIYIIFKEKLHVFSLKTHIKLYKNTFLTWIQSTQIPIWNYKHICTLYIVQQKKGSTFKVCFSACLPYNKFSEFDRNDYIYFFWSMVEQKTGSYAWNWGSHDSSMKW